MVCVRLTTMRPSDPVVYEPKTGKGLVSKKEAALHADDPRLFK